MKGTYAYRCTARSVALETEDTDDLAGLALALWDTAARVAVGRKPNDRDKRALQDGRFALSNQCRMIEYVSARADAASAEEPAPFVSFSFSGDLLEIIWEAAVAVNHHLPETINGAEELIHSIEQIEQGNEQVAESLVPLFKRVALMAEQRSS